MFVSDIIGDYIVFPYSSVALVMAVYVLSSVSLDFPQCVVVSDFSILWSSLCLSCFVYVLQKCVWGRMLDLEFLCFCP